MDRLLWHMQCIVSTRYVLKAQPIESEEISSVQARRGSTNLRLAASSLRSLCMHCDSMAQ